MIRKLVLADLLSSKDATDLHLVKNLSLSTVKGGKLVLQQPWSLAGLASSANLPLTIY